MFTTPIAFFDTNNLGPGGSIGLNYCPILIPDFESSNSANILIFCPSNFNLVSRVTI